MDDIRHIERPVRLSQDDYVMTASLWDILWSDPTEDDSVVGIQPNAQRAGEGVCDSKHQTSHNGVPHRSDELIFVRRGSYLEIWPRSSERVLCSCRTQADHSCP